MLYIWWVLSANIVGEWWKTDTEKIISQALKTGAAPNVSDAYTINGLPGPSYNCSAKGTVQLLLTLCKFGLEMFFLDRPD